MAQWIRTPPPPEEPEEEQEPKASRRKRRKRGDRAPVKAPPEEPRHNIRASLPWRPDTAGSAGSKFRSILIGPSPPEASPKNLHSDVTRESVYLDDLCARLAHVTRKHGLDRIRDLPQHSTMCENLPIASLEIRNKLIKSQFAIAAASSAPPPRRRRGRLPVASGRGLLPWRLSAGASQSG